MSGYRVTFARVVRSEWTKFWSLRSTWIVLAVTILITLGVAGAVGWAQGNNTDHTGQVPAVSEVIGGTFLGVDLFSIVLGVFGVLMMTGEYGSGLIRATLTAVPRRLPLLGAKALVLTAGTLPLMVVISFASLLISVTFSGADVGLGDPGVLRAVLGAAVAPVAFGVIGLGLGTALRHTAGSITVLVLTTLVLPGLLPALPGSAPEDMAPYSPIAAAQAMYSIADGGGPFDVFSPGPAALVLAGWVAVALAAGATVLRRRDA
jgi:ABC-2 type transport system permease protein